MIAVTSANFLPTYSYTNICKDSDQHLSIFTSNFIYKSVSCLIHNFYLYSPKKSKDFSLKISLKKKFQENSKYMNQCNIFVICCWAYYIFHHLLFELVWIGDKALYITSAKIARAPDVDMGIVHISLLKSEYAWLADQFSFILHS